MQLKIKVNGLAVVYNAIYELELKGRVSFSRSLLCKKLMEKMAESDEENKELAKQYAKVDAEGELILDENNILSFENNEKQQEYQKAALDLQNSIVTIDYTEYQERFEQLFDTLENYDKELSGSKAEAIFILLESKEEKENVENK